MGELACILFVEFVRRISQCPFRGDKSETAIRQCFPSEIGGTRHQILEQLARRDECIDQVALRRRLPAERKDEAGTVVQIEWDEHDIQRDRTIFHLDLDLLGHGSAFQDHAGQQAAQSRVAT